MFFPSRRDLCPSPERTAAGFFPPSYEAGDHENAPVTKPKRKDNADDKIRLTDERERPRVRAPRRNRKVASWYGRSPACQKGSARNRKKPLTSDSGELESPPLAEANASVRPSEEVAGWARCARLARFAEGVTSHVSKERRK